jgi:hypothetical protein
MTILPVDPAGNKLFRWADQLPAEYFDRLAGRDPEAVRRLSGAGFDPADKTYALEVLGERYVVSPTARTIHGPGDRVDFQTGLVILLSLLQDRPAGLAGEWVPERQLPGGNLFFQGPHALPTGALAKRFGRDAAGFLEAAGALGGRPVPDMGDAAVRLPVTPMLLVTLVLWLGDDEFKPAVKVLFDRNAADLLPLDGLWAAINIIRSRLIGPAKNPGPALPDTGACGLNCAACRLSVRGACSPCGAGTSDVAADKLAAQRRLLGSECPILACAAAKNVPHCPRDCDEFPCDRFQGYPFSPAFIDMQRRRRSQLDRPS